VLRAVGVDLAGSVRRITGICFMDSSLVAELSRAHYDDEIISFISRHGVTLAAIDAPLSFPRRGERMRKCDKDLRKAGIRLFSPLLGPMKALTERGVRLKKLLKDLGYEVIEVFPTGARSFLGLPPKKAGRRALLSALTSLGIKGIPDNADQHMLDAVICALVGLYYLKGEYVKFGDWREGVIVMPKPEARSSERRSLGKELR